MKAVRVKEWGAPVVLEEIPQPTPSHDEVLVRVHAASINPFDAMVHAGYLQGMLSTPLILGTDFAGEVVEVGSDITDVKPGDAVYGMVPMRTGTFAEYVTATAGEISVKPKSLDYIHAAAVPLASLAAWQSLFDLAQLQQGERLLVLGAAGSVGSCAVQLAKGRASYIYGTGKRNNSEFLRGLGVDRFINSGEERFEDVVKDVDVVLDYVGGDSLERSYQVLRPGGRLRHGRDDADAAGRSRATWDSQHGSDGTAEPCHSDEACGMDRRRKAQGVRQSHFPVERSPGRDELPGGDCCARQDRGDD